MSPLILRDPEPVRTGRRREPEHTEWHALLGPAKKKVGRWFEVTPSYESSAAAASAAYEINSGRLAGLPEGEWEATSRTREVLDDADNLLTVIGVLFVRCVK